MCNAFAGGGGVAASREVMLHLKHGVEAKNYEDVSLFPRVQHLNSFEQ